MSASPPTLSVRSARRLALARAGLLKPSWTGMPQRAAGRGARARRAATTVIDRFGYLQLDTVATAGARSHALVLLSRIEGFDPTLAEDLLTPGAPLFEYWGHEACWIPIDLWPAFGWRRAAYRNHPWWGDVLSRERALANELLARIEAEGPLRTVDLEGSSDGGWWNHKLSKKVANALWSAGELMISERRAFQRLYDLPSRVLQAALGTDSVPDAAPLPDALAVLLLRALDGHGWATTGTLAATWRLRNLRPEIGAALEHLVDQGAVQRARLRHPDRTIDGWVRPADLELASRLDTARPRRDRGVLLSPFDPVLWDRRRVRQFFDFDQVLEIFKPATERRWGYFSLPVLAGEHLIARIDLKAERKRGRLVVRAVHFERDSPTAEDRSAVRTALERHARSVGLAPLPRPREAAGEKGPSGP